MFGFEIEDVVVDGSGAGRWVQTHGSVAVVPVSGQRLLAPGGEFLAEVAEPVDHFLAR